MSKSYCGYISIIGKPNVGKSTILNHILGKKVSITSRKSQTTRNNILGIKTVENKQMIFADTPGMHIKSPKVMNKVLNRSAQSLIDDSDIILDIIPNLCSLSLKISSLSFDINPISIPLFVNLWSALSALKLSLYSALEVNIL